jgi:hypothetical protein
MKALFHLSPSDVLGNWATIAIFNFKLHFIAFSECLKARHIYRGKVHENFLPVFLRNEAVSLLLIKPLNSSFWQSYDLLKNFFIWSQASGLDFDKRKNP